MTPKSIVKKRLGVALGKAVSDKQFAEFFAYFCERTGRKDLRFVRQLSDSDLILFGRFAGYDLRFPIPLPLW